MATTTKVVRKNTSAAAKKEAKIAKQARNKNKGKLNAKAKREYKHMSPKQKKQHLEKVVWRKAKAHGASDAEADKAVLIYKKRRQNRNAGKHAAEQRRQATSLQKQVRGNIKMKSQKLSEGHKKALQKIRTAKVAPAVKSKMRNAEKQRYASERTQLAKERNKAVKSHSQRLTKIKTIAQKHGPIKLSSLISNYSKRTLGQKGKRLKTVTAGAPVAKTKAGGAVKKSAAAKKAPAKKAAGGETAAISDKHFAVKGKPGRKPKNPTPAADAPVAKTKRAYVKKAKAADAPAHPAAKAVKGKKNPTAKVATPATEGKPKRAYNKKPKADAAPAAEAPKAKRAYKKRAKPEAAPVAEAPKAKRAYKKRAKPEAAPATEVKAKRAYKKRAKPEAAPAAEAPKAKRAYKKRAKPEAAPAAKAPAKAVKKTAAKPAAKKAAAKPAAKKAAAKAPAKAAPKGGVTAKKTGAAVPAKKTAGGNKRANLG